MKNRAEIIVKQQYTEYNYDDKRQETEAQCEDNAVPGTKVGQHGSW